MLLLFLKAYSSETDLWETLGVFAVKKTQKMVGESVYNLKSIR